MLLVEGEIASYRGVDVRWAHDYQGNQQKGTHLTAPLIRTITSGRPRQVCRKARVSVSEAGTGRVKEKRPYHAWQGRGRKIFWS